MKRLVSVTVSMAALGAASAFAADAAPAAVSATPAGSADVPSAKVRFINKNNNRVTDVDVAAGKQTVGLPLNITLKRCVRDVQGVPGQDVAWLDVAEAQGNVPVYSGWMFNFYPDVAALENPRYEVRLVSCARTGPVMTPQIRRAPRDAPANMGGGDEEAPGGDPNFVPGVQADEPPAPPAAVAPEAAPVEAPVQAPPPSGDQDELHDMMDGGGLPERSTDQ